MKDPMYLIRGKIITALNGNITLNMKPFDLFLICEHPAAILLRHGYGFASKM